MAKKQEINDNAIVGTSPITQQVLGRKVKVLQIHQATNINGQVKSSIGTKQEAVEMTIVPMGVLLQFVDRLGKPVEKLIFANNVYEAELV